MKLVDENGKLFKKFNLVDAIVVLLVVVIIVAIGWKAVSASIANQKEVVVEEQEQVFATSPHLVYDVVCTNVPQEVAEACAQQMELPMTDRQIMNGGNLVEGYITDCWYEPNEDDDLYTLYFTLEAMLTEKEGIYSVGTQEIRIGKGYIVKTYQIETSGHVYSMEVTGKVAGEVTGEVTGND